MNSKKLSKAEANKKLVEQLSNRVQEADLGRFAIFFKCSDMAGEFILYIFFGSLT